MNIDQELLEARDAVGDVVSNTVGAVSSTAWVVCAARDASFKIVNINWTAYYAEGVYKDQLQYQIDKLVLLLK